MPNLSKGTFGSGRSDEVRKFTASMSRITQAVRALLIPASKISEFLDLLQSVSTKGVETIEKADDPKEYRDLANEFVNSITQYLGHGLTEEEQSSFFNGEFDGIDKALVELEAKKPKSEGAQKQWEASKQEVAAKIEEMRERMMQYKEDGELLEALQIFAQAVTTSTMMRLSDLTMTKRSELVTVVKRSVDKLLSFVKNWRQQGTINQGAIQEIKGMISRADVIFRDPNGESKTIRPSTSLPEVEPLKKEAPAEAPDTRLKDAKRNNKLFKERIATAEEEEKQLRTKVEELSALLTHNRQEFESLRLSKAEFNVFGQCEAMKKTKAMLHGEIEAMTQELPTLKEKVDSYQENHDEYQEVYEKEVELRKLNDHLKLVRKRLASRENELDKGVSDLTSYAVDSKTVLSQSASDVRSVENDMHELEEKLQELSNKDEPQDEGSSDSPDSHRLNRILQAIKSRNNGLSTDVKAKSPIELAIEQCKQEIEGITAQIASLEQRQRPSETPEVKRSIFDPYNKKDEQRMVYQSEALALKKAIEKAKTRAVQYNGKDMTLAESKAALESLERQHDELEIQLQGRPPLYQQLEEATHQIADEREKTISAFRSQVARRKEILDIEKQLDECESEQALLQKVCSCVQIRDFIPSEEQERFKALLVQKMTSNGEIRDLDQSFSDIFRDRLMVRTSLAVPEKIATIVYMLPKVPEKK